MPFSGGGGGQLSNHVHDNTPLQGGPLNFNNTTIGGMNAGDITYSDGAALQTLVYPAVPAGETLTAAALSTAPTWAAAGGAAGWELVDSQVLAVDAAFIQSSFPAINQSDVSCFKVIVNVEKINAGNELGGRLNNLITNYDENFFETYGGLTGGWLTVGNNHFGLIMNAKGTHCTGEWTIWCHAVSDTLQCLWRGGTSITNTITSQTNTTAGQTSLSDVYIYPTAGNLRAGSRIDVYRVNI